MATGELSYRDYLEALYEMAEEGIPTQQARLAEWLGVTPASVSEAIKRLVQRGMVVHSEGRLLDFSAEGRRMAEVLVRRHRLAERFLVEIVGLPWHLAHEEATAWGPVISDQVEGRLIALLDDPATCVHGNPIPGSRYPVDHSQLLPLHDAPQGERLRLERLTEDLELDLSVMKFFEESGLLPGAELRIASEGPDGTLTLEVEGRGVALGPHLADNLWVRSL
ncbi:MAG TPA: metal-dependent transcriptional regulator [Actinomycetota bacterium]|nr:metal-dependent transcriptional regulator [Actinomycetota bacterium]